MFCILHKIIGYHTSVDIILDWLMTIDYIQIWIKLKEKIDNKRRYLEAQSQPWRQQQSIKEAEIFAIGWQRIRRERERATAPRTGRISRRPWEVPKALVKVLGNRQRLLSYSAVLDEAEAYLMGKWQPWILVLVIRYENLIFRNCGHAMFCILLKIIGWPNVWLEFPMYICIIDKILPSPITFFV